MQFERIKIFKIKYPYINLSGQFSKHILRQCKSLISGFAQPFNGLFIIFFYTITLVITNTK